MGKIKNTINNVRAAFRNASLEIVGAAGFIGAAGLCWRASSLHVNVVQRIALGILALASLSAAAVALFSLVEKKRREQPVKARDYWNAVKDELCNNKFSTATLAGCAVASGVSAIITTPFFYTFLGIGLVLLTTAHAKAVESVRRGQFSQVRQTFQLLTSKP